MKIGENIKKLRLERSLTQEALAAAVGVSGQAVSKWECEESLPDAALFIPIADALEVSLDRLCGREKVYEYDLHWQIYKYLNSFEQSEQMEKVRELCWRIHKSIFGGFVNDKTDFTFVPDELKDKTSQSAFTNDNAFSLISNHRDMPFYSIFFEPENGFGSAVKYDEKCRKFLEAMGDEHVLKALFALHSKECGTYIFEKEVLAAECGIPDDKIDFVMEKLELFAIMGGESWLIPDVYEINGESHRVYTSFPSYKIAALLIMIQAIAYPTNYSECVSCKRKAPYFRSADAGK